PGITITRGGFTASGRYRSPVIFAPSAPASVKLSSGLFIAVGRVDFRLFDLSFFFIHVGGGEIAFTGQLADAAQAERAQELGGGAVQRGRARLAAVALGDLDQPAIQQRAHQV